MSTTRILGISSFYHDSAAALVCGGEIIAAAQEERFTRKKHDAGFPGNAISYCLLHAGVSLSDLDCIVYYEKPFVKFERLLETYLAFSPHGLMSFFAAMPVWLREKMFLKRLLKKELMRVGHCRENELPQLLFSEHHEAHAASAFFPSPFERAAILCLDGVGEWAAASVWHGEGNSLTPHWQLDFPHSLGLLYSAFTYQCGFRVNSGEYKVMGLAPYGEPRYVKDIMGNLLDLKDDGTFRLDMQYFNFAVGMTMTSRHFDSLFGGPPRAPGTPITRREMDLARSVQDVTEEIVLRLARTVHRELGADALCMAGGVALNCVANGRVMREGPFRDVWVQPAAGDAGAALGAALAAYHLFQSTPRQPHPEDAMQGGFLGPEYVSEEIYKALESESASYRFLPDEELFTTVAGLLEQGKVIGWFQGRMEFGPRALGGRSIIADARYPNMQSLVNHKIKFRESFRPFAPCVLDEDTQQYFELDRSSPYMLFTASVRESQRIERKSVEEIRGINKLANIYSAIPAVTHVDYSARVQTVSKEKNTRLYRLLKAFKELTGCSVLLNTSFNIQDEPIVNRPEEAYRCFMRTEMDYLVMGNVLLDKRDQPTRERENGWGS